MRALQPCGTRAAYQRHLAHREVPCQACTEANRRKAPAGQAKAERLAVLDEVAAQTIWRGRRAS